MNITDLIAPNRISRIQILWRTVILGLYKMPRLIVFPNGAPNVKAWSGHSQFCLKGKLVNLVLKPLKNRVQTGQPYDKTMHNLFLNFVSCHTLSATISVLWLMWQSSLDTFSGPLLLVEIIHPINQVSCQESFSWNIPSLPISCCPCFWSIQYFSFILKYFFFT